MTRVHWLVEAKYLFHAHVPGVQAAWVDEVTQALCAAFDDLEPDEAVAMYVANQLEAAWQVPSHLASH